MIKSKIFIFLVIAGLIIIPLTTRAFSFDDFFADFEGFLPWEQSADNNDNVEIINEINVSANTGGNVSEGGEIKEGEGKINVEIKNIVNGESIEPVEIESDANEVQVKSRIEVENGEASVEREIEIDGEKTQENYEVDLSDSQTETKIEWWEDFKEEVKSFFQDIFDIFSVATAFAEEGETIIETGDAVAEGEIENIVNSNIVEEEIVEEEPVEEEVEEVEEIIEEEPAEEETAQEESSPEEPDNDLIIENENEAVVENEAEISADTGGNTASGGGSAVIESGNAGAQANVVNIVNSNILSSNGFLFFMNRFSALFGNLNFNGLDFPAEGEASSLQEPQDPCDSCSGQCCHDDLTVSNNNNAVITNTIIVRSSTGNNSSENNSGNAEINTGNAYAAANVVNIANTNIIGSNYLLLVFNNFGDWVGDLVFPGKDFFSQHNNNHRRGRTEVANNNQAVVQNNTEVIAETGNNEANNNGSSVIQTGDAYSSASVVNDINNNLFNNDNSLLILLRVHGNWSGNVFSAPPGIFWNETDLGLEIFSDSSDEDEEIETEEMGEDGAVGEQIITNNNTAEINNDVQVLALTGENKVEDNGGESAIDTGDAYAVANILNVVNSNIIGQNWLLAMINIFGDWDGDIAFGRPDLWVGGRAETEHNPASPGSEISYYLTIANRGDADATGVTLTSLFDNDYMAFLDSDGEWDIGNIPTGGSVEINYKTKVSENIPLGETIINNTVRVSSTETDEDTKDNTDVIILLAYRENPSPPSSGAEITYTPDPILTITKTCNGGATTFTASSTVDFTITVMNNGGSAYHAILTDTIKNETGEIIHEEEWDLDEIFPDEEITVTYSMVFNGNTPPGTYTNYAKVEAIGRSPITDPFYGWFSNSPVVSSAIEIIGSGTSQEQEEEGAEFSFSDAENKLNEMKNVLLGMSEVVRRFLPQVLASGISGEEGGAGEIGERIETSFVPLDLAAAIGMAWKDISQSTLKSILVIILLIILFLLVSKEIRRT